MSESSSPPTLEAPEADASVFADMAVTAENHFALHFHAAVYALIAAVRRLREQNGQEPETVFDDYPFLGGYLNEHLGFMPEGLTWDEGGRWWGIEIQRWEETADRHVPLRELSTTLGLSMAQRLAFVGAGLLEEDSRFGTLFADLQAPVSSRRPTVELLGRIVQEVEADVDGWSACRPLVQARLTTVVDRSRPRAEWAVRVPFVLWEAARGEVPSALKGAVDRTQVRLLQQAPAFEDLIVPNAFRDRLRQVPRMLQDGSARHVIVRGPMGTDRRAALDAVAREMGRGVVRVQADERSDSRGRGANTTGTMPDPLGPFCVLTRTMPVLEVDLAPGESYSIPSIAGYEGPIGIAMGESGGLTGDALDTAITMTLDALSAAERRRHWQAAFEAAEAEVDVADLDAIVEGVQLPGRYLRRAGTMAVRQAVLDGRDTVTIGDVRRAGRSLGRQLLDTLAERIEADGAWDHLVVDPTAEEKLRDLERRCHHRERVLDHLGPAFGAGTTKGVRALFAGPSGTGKTLAARILAAELEMDLYRVDLAAVINKYVGETEKNLHRVLSTAEALDVMLLLDEGDALLGRRTEVSTANDRYANVETNYLLQRLEQYRGIVLVTSNLADNIDPAFQRRMDLVVDFTPPSADERLDIWAIHLPVTHAVSDTLLRRVARTCSMNGGQIRNAALQATLLALDESKPSGSPPQNGTTETGAPEGGDQTPQVRDDHLLAAVRDEYRKAGAICPLTEEAAEETRSGAQQFVRGMSRAEE